MIRACMSVFTLLFTFSSVSFAEIPRPEHPMPQEVRDEWLNLNGQWEYGETMDNEDESFLEMDTFPETITVPFARESELSGIGRTGFMTNVWYRRNFEVPENWDAERIRLHIGACDWITRVWVNGDYVGRHQGGNVAFSFDVTKYLQDGENTVIVHAFDDSASGLQPLGKQSIREESYSIFYTRTTGIWQTVWLEGVGSSFIRDFKIETDPDKIRADLQIEIDGPSDGLTVEAVAMADGKVVAQASSPADWRNNRMSLQLSERHLWSVDDPFLYDLTLRLKDGNEVVDEVESYFGLRDVAIEGRAILINGKTVFQRLVLDQGFYPKGIWTAPSDEALKKDIELAQSVGFNGARLHQKVFEPRFLYWADKMGYLVWGEYPSYGASYSNPAVNRPIIDEWVEILRRDRNHPSIIGWCAFNETPESASELQNTVLELTQAIDPTRPVLDTSGWTHSYPDPEVMDAHDYNQDPETFRDHWARAMTAPPLPERYGTSTVNDIPFFVSEFGGIGWFETDDESWGYGNNPTTEKEFFDRFEGLTHALLDNRYMFGYCYTQLTDIEQEKNGVFTYDREPKFDSKKFYDIQTKTAAFEENPPLEVKTSTPDFKVLFGANPDGNTVWHYTNSEPGDNWMEPGYTASGWQTGKGAFGQEENTQRFIETEWTSDDIWLRHQFEYDGDDFDVAYLVTHYDNETTVYINGKQVWNREGWNNNYEGFDVTEAVRDALQEGTNTVAIHCHQDEGGQFIDAALLID